MGKFLLAGLQAHCSLIKPGISPTYMIPKIKGMRNLLIEFGGKTNEEMEEELSRHK